MHTLVSAPVHTLAHTCGGAELKTRSLRHTLEPFSARCADLIADLLQHGYQIEAPAYETYDVPAGTYPKELAVVMKAWQEEQRDLNAKRGKTPHEAAEALQHNIQVGPTRAQSRKRTRSPSNSGQPDNPICLT